MQDRSEAQPQLTLRDITKIVEDVECSVGGTAWNAHVGRMGDGFYVQLQYVEPDVLTGDPEDQHGRKWYLSSFSNKSEIVQTVLKACLTSAEHMVREHFTYRGCRVFNPHFDVDTLADACSDKPDSRLPRMFNGPGGGA